MTDGSNNLPKILPANGNQDGNNFGVIIPCSTEEFGHFVSKLLGEPQTITSNVDGAFVVDREVIYNIFNLVQQRVHQQNESSLVQWTITILYDDKSSVKLDSMHEFKSYAEIKSRVSLGFNIHFSYLVKFRERKTPEKQIIDVSFNVGEPHGVLITPRILSFDAGFIVRIEHTARSWGVDLESLLVGQLASVRKIYQSAFRAFLVKRRSSLEPTLVSTFFCAAMIGLIIQTHVNGVASADRALHQFSDSPDAPQIARLLRFNINQLASGVIQENLLITLLITILVLVSSVIVANLIDNRVGAPVKGALLLTKEAEKSFESTQKSEKKLWIEVFITFLLGVGAGVIANYAYAWLTR